MSDYNHELWTSRLKGSERSVELHRTIVSALNPLDRNARCIYLIASGRPASRCFPIWPLIVSPQRWFAPNNRHQLKQSFQHYQANKIPPPILYRGSIATTVLHSPFISSLISSHSLLLRSIAMCAEGCIHWKHFRTSLWSTSRAIDSNEMNIVALAIAYNAPTSIRRQLWWSSSNQQMRSTLFSPIS